MKRMKRVYDFGTGIPYTDEDLERLLVGITTVPNAGACMTCSWFTSYSTEICRGPITCIKWVDCGKCCPLTGRDSLIPFETCRYFLIDPLMAQG